MFNFDLDGSDLRQCYLWGQYFSLFRMATYNDIWLEKLAVVGLPCDKSKIEVDERRYGMGECTELKWSGDVAYLPAPIYKTDCAARYPDHYPDYVEGVDY